MAHSYRLRAVRQVFGGKLWMASASGPLGGGTAASGRRCGQAAFSTIAA